MTVVLLMGSNPVSLFTEANQGIQYRKKNWKNFSKKLWWEFLVSKSY